MRVHFQQPWNGCSTPRTGVWVCCPILRTCHGESRSLPGEYLDLQLYAFLYVCYVQHSHRNHYNATLASKRPKRPNPVKVRTVHIAPRTQNGSGGSHPQECPRNALGRQGWRDQRQWSIQIENSSAFGLPYIYIKNRPKRTQSCRSEGVKNRRPQAAHNPSHHKPLSTLLSLSLSSFFPSPLIPTISPL